MLLVRPRPALSMGGSVLVAQGLTAAVGLIGARSLGPAGKGQVTAALSWAQILVFVFLFGLSFALSVRIAESRGEGLESVLGNALLYAAVVSVIVGGVAAILLPLILTGLGPGTSTLMRWAILAGCITIVGDLLVSIHIALGHNLRYSAYRLTLPLLNVAIIVPLWLTDRLTPGWVIAGFLIGAIVSLAVVSPALPWRTMTVDLAALRKDLAYGFKSYLPSLLGLVNLRLDILIMSVFLSSTVVGLYGLANNVMVPLTAFPAAGGLLLMRSVARGVAQDVDGQHSRVAEIRRTARRYLLLAVGIGAVIFFTAPFVVPVLLGSRYGPSVVLIQILVPGYVARAYLAVITMGLVGTRRPMVGNVAEAVALIVTVVLLAMLLPRYGAIGAAIASTGAYLTAAVVGRIALLRMDWGTVPTLESVDPIQAASSSAEFTS